MKGLAAVAALMGLVLIFGCEDNRPVAPVDDRVTVEERLVPENQRRSTVQDGYPYWVNNYMAFEDAQGNFWEWEREGSNGVYPVVRLYKNGNYKGRIEMEYSSPFNPVADTLRTPEGHWADRAGDGEILAMQPREPLIHPTGVVIEASIYSSLKSCVTYAGVVLLDDGGPCDDEADAAYDAALSAAVTGTLGTALNMLTGGAFAVPTMAAMSIATARALGKLGAWAGCLLTH